MANESRHEWLKDLGEAMHAAARQVDAAAVGDAANHLGRELARQRHAFRLEDFVRATGLRPAIARDAAVVVFRRVVAKAWADDLLSEGEALELEQIAALLALPRERRDAVLDDAAVDAMRRREGLPPIDRSLGASTQRLLGHAQRFLGRLTEMGREAAHAASARVVRAGEAFHERRAIAPPPAPGAPAARPVAPPPVPTPPAAPSPVASASRRSLEQPLYRPPQSFQDYCSQSANLVRIRPSRRQLWLARSLGADLSRFDRPRVAARLTQLLKASDPLERRATLEAQSRAVGIAPASTSIAELWADLADRLEEVEFADETDLLEIHSFGLVPERAFSPAEAESIREAAEDFSVSCPTCRGSFARTLISCPVCGWPAFQSPIVVHLAAPDPYLGVRWWEASAAAR